MKKVILGLMSIILVLGFAGIVRAEVNSVTPSTNDINRTNGWAHVNEISVDVGEVTLDFVQPRDFYACFEYRTDGDTSQVIDEEHWLEYYGVVPPGDLQQYPYFCLSTISSQTETITANEYVEIRMMFGAEGDERFDWTRFDVLYLRNAEITSPTSGEVVHGNVDFTAYLDDDDSDFVQWAVREGTCAAGVGTVFGNVDGHSDGATTNTSDLSMQTFSFTGDMSIMTPGMYCFIYNPVEDSGESDIRETVEFNLVEQIGPPVDKSECKKDGWMEFNNPSFKNQGDCVSFVATDGRNPGNGY